MCICCNVWVQALTRTHLCPHLFSNNWQLAAVLDKCHIIFNVIHWRCDLNPLLNHSTIKSLPYWSAKGLLLLQKVVWFWSFFWKCLYTFNSLTPALCLTCVHTWYRSVNISELNLSQKSKQDKRYTMWHKTHFVKNIVYSSDNSMPTIFWTILFTAFHNCLHGHNHSLPSHSLTFFSSLSRF